MVIKFVDENGKEKTFNANKVAFNHYVNKVIAENTKTGKKFMCDTTDFVEITESEDK